jgi:hypothetical protein
MIRLCPRRPAAQLHHQQRVVLAVEAFAGFVKRVVHAGRGVIHLPARLQFGSPQGDLRKDRRPRSRVRPGRLPDDRLLQLPQIGKRRWRTKSWVACCSLLRNAGLHSISRGYQPEPCAGVRRARYSIV